MISRVDKTMKSALPLKLRSTRSRRASKAQLRTDRRERAMVWVKGWVWVKVKGLD